jgi:hypothetical protein
MTMDTPCIKKTKNAYPKCCPNAGNDSSREDLGNWIYPFASFSAGKKYLPKMMTILTIEK